MNVNTHSGDVSNVLIRNTVTLNLVWRESGVPNGRYVFAEVGGRQKESNDLRFGCLAYE